MDIIRYEELSSPIGTLTLGISPSGALCQIDFGPFESNRLTLEAWSKRWFGTSCWEPDAGSAGQAREELEAYFAGQLDRFTTPLELRGTSFQLSVWDALRTVPFGTVCAYKDIAERLGAPKAVRAVGGANNRNPVPIIVPCHRVIGAGGGMVGYGGGLEVKTFLLRLEGHAAGGEA
ncbi:methylated-DNA--[protein]-cysteine S-methyltransferase [Paenibacillus sp. YYML68]|uniref:methylated-DNA--[protein]-cysteine S-methyltransferase n=1 Tax=Paenibacillus sp. YYML68 TaxID=2909250 RepID=UPI00249369B7|nr:methylated-DNA--[protein]-cysteine S-methyltransferase [Paenibacillus sp. YYML68]